MRFSENIVLSNLYIFYGIQFSAFQGPDSGLSPLVTGRSFVGIRVYNLMAIIP